MGSTQPPSAHGTPATIFSPEHLQHFDLLRLADEIDLLGTQVTKNETLVTYISWLHEQLPSIDSSYQDQYESQISAWCDQLSARGFQKGDVVHEFERFSMSIVAVDPFAARRLDMASLEIRARFSAADINLPLSESRSYTTIKTDVKPSPMPEEGLDSPERFNDGSIETPITERGHDLRKDGLAEGMKSKKYLATKYHENWASVIATPGAMKRSKASSRSPETGDGDSHGATALVNWQDLRLTESKNHTLKRFPGVPRGSPPNGYVCKRCHIQGHWVQGCPTNLDPSWDSAPPSDYKCAICGARGKHLHTLCPKNTDRNSLTELRARFGTVQINGDGDGSRSTNDETVQDNTDMHPDRSRRLRNRGDSHSRGRGRSSSPDSAPDRSPDTKESDHKARKGNEHGDRYRPLYRDSRRDRSLSPHRRQRNRSSSPHHRQHDRSSSPHRRHRDSHSPPPRHRRRGRSWHHRDGHGSRADDGDLKTSKPRLPHLYSHDTNRMDEDVNDMFVHESRRDQIEAERRRRDSSRSPVSYHVKKKSRVVGSPASPNSDGSWGKFTKHDVGEPARIPDKSNRLSPPPSGRGEESPHGASSKPNSPISMDDDQHEMLLRLGFSGDWRKDAEDFWQRCRAEILGSFGGGYVNISYRKSRSRTPSPPPEMDLDALSLVLVPAEPDTGSRHGDDDDVVVDCHRPHQLASFPPEVQKMMVGLENPLVGLRKGRCSAIDLWDKNEYGNAHTPLGEDVEMMG